MGGYIGSRAVNLSTTAADVSGNATIGGNLTVSGTTVTIDSANAQTVDLGDNDKIRMGDGDDLQLYHDGSNSYISESGTGDLNITSNSNLSFDVAGYIILDTDNGNIYLNDDGTGFGQISGASQNLTFKSSASDKDIIFQGNDGGSAITALTLDMSDAGTAIFNNKVGIGTSAPIYAADIKTSGTNNGQLRVGGGSTSATGLLFEQTNSGTTSANIQNSYYATSASASLSIKSGVTTFHTGTSGTERMRIDSSGNVNIGSTSNAGFGPLQLGNTSSASTIIQMLGSTSGNNTIHFGDATSGSARYRGYIQYAHGNDSLQFGTVAAERMRLDSGGALLIGKTVDTQADAGHVFFGQGAGYSTRNGFTWLHNRLSTEGEILRLQKDSSTIGTIGVDSGSGYDVLYIANGDSGLAFQGYADNALIPFDANGMDKRDAAIDLGIASGRFKDLYLSGGAYIGGTGDSNKLEDYEEGTWTPTFVSGVNSSAYTHQYGFYTKVGRVVHFELDIQANTTASSGLVQIGNLPFTTGNTSRMYANAQINYQGSFLTAAHTGSVSFHMGPGGTAISLYNSNGTNFVGTSANNINGRIILSGRYFAT